ncbi:helix-turn-helix domain-containing protein [Streptococcus oralis]|jgi:phage transcriptional regulator, cro/CI family|uniref:helix-turn-helix domain-containing protein n=1 Tax=Streptococcus oralis TaxID=1303 RepID=UPI0010EA04BD|nr:helix-turn-helix transcriptional regulator [Streptococcus oralis]VSG33348.1 Cro/CI family phage transcriptional regulator [Streptococcus pneumoniae]DAK40082.1 MAG TPA: repressor protein [Caudoviricetes sp.]MCB7107543.1 helix-turn-helix domain-containing protein [Streptococcus oralis]MCQ5169846.1 helix-turn-helix domain-containing protein [Streptococcus oralis]MCY7096413.1 helix-turn-helix domain-containing protein [Streptococcus oralis]
MFQTFDRIKELAKKQGLSINLLEEKLGYSRNTIYNLKNSKPSTERISEIADYFHVSTDYLLGRTDNPTIASDNKANTNLGPAETELVAAFRNQTQNMTEEEKVRFNKAIESLMVTAKTLMDDDSKWR